MPPKTQISREQIIKTAVSVARKYGIEAVQARTLATKLRCSIQPIYWNFTTIDELRKVVVDEAKKTYKRYIQKEIPGLTRYKAIGWNYIQFAKKEPQLFRLLYMTPTLAGGPIMDTQIDDNKDFILQQIVDEYGFSMELANIIYIRMWVFSHGIATLIVTNTVSISESEIGAMLTDMMQGLLAKFKGTNNNDSN